MATSVSTYLAWQIWRQRATPRQLTAWGAVAPPPEWCPRGTLGSNLGCPMGENRNPIFVPGYKMFPSCCILPALIFSTKKKTWTTHHDKDPRPNVSPFFLYEKIKERSKDYGKNSIVVVVCWYTVGIDFRPVYWLIGQGLGNRLMHSIHRICEKSNVRGQWTAFRHRFTKLAVKKHHFFLLTSPQIRRMPR